MRREILQMLKLLGGPVTVVTGGREEAHRAVLEPVASLARQSARRQMRALGQVPQSQYLYVGLEDVSGADFLLRRGKKFVPRLCEEASLGGQGLFFWGLCVPVGEEEAWKD